MSDESERCCNDSLVQDHRPSAFLSELPVRVWPAVCGRDGQLQGPLNDRGGGRKEHDGKCSGRMSAKERERTSSGRRRSPSPRTSSPAVTNALALSTSSSSLPPVTRGLAQGGGYYYGMEVDLVNADAPDEEDDAGAAETRGSLRGRWLVSFKYGSASTHVEEEHKVTKGQQACTDRQAARQLSEDVGGGSLR